LTYILLDAGKEVFSRAKNKVVLKINQVVRFLNCQKLANLENG